MLSNEVKKSIFEHLKIHIKQLFKKLRYLWVLC